MTPEIFVLVSLNSWTMGKQGIGILGFIDMFAGLTLFTGLTLLIRITQN